MKKIYKIIIAALLAVFILYSYVELRGVSNVYAADSSEEIKVGQTLTIPSVDNLHTCDVYFTPEKDGDYVICVDAKGLSSKNGFSFSPEDGKSVNYKTYNGNFGYNIFRNYSGLKAGIKYKISFAYYATEGSTVTLTCDEPKNYLYCATVYKIKNKSTVSSEITVPYTKKEFEISDYVLAYSYKDGNYTKYQPYEYGKDYKIAKYITRNNYQNSAISGSLMWKEGSPSEKGDYVVRLEAMGKIKGYFDIYVKIQSEFDMDYFPIDELEVTTKNIEIEAGNTLVYAVRPKVSGNYAIVLKIEDYIGYLQVAIFDSFGNYCDQVTMGDMGYDYYPCAASIFTTLEGGKIYYLCVVNGMSNSNSFSEKTKAKISILGEESAYIYKDPNAPEIDIKAEDKKTDEKSEEQKTDSKNQSTTTQQATTAPVKQSERAVAFAKGKKFTAGNITYKVTSSKKGSYQVSVVSCKNKKAKSVTILDTVKYKGISYKVTGIGANAFKNMGSLKSITIKSTKLTKVGANAFKGINKNATIKVPKTKKKSYTKLLSGKGQAKTVKIK